MVIVPDDAELRERVRLRHERFQKLTEGKSERFKRRMARVERTQMGQDIPKVRVLPKSDELREILVHPNGNLAFREHGSVEWPLDQFTLRRLRDGDVTLDTAHGHQPVRRASAPGGRDHHENERARRAQPPPPTPRPGETS